MRVKVDNASLGGQSVSRNAYVPPFNVIRKALGLDHADLAPGKHVSIPIELFKSLMGGLLAQGFFDERWYLETYPDVEAAINRGNVSNALGSVEIHRELMTAATRWIIAWKLWSVLSARMAIRLNSLSLQKKFSIR
jgi:hypothetical protein